jgi:hypothetical protein
LAAEALCVPWKTIGSLICLPTRCTGFMALIAPWKTMAAWVQRTARALFSPSASTSTPSRRTLPATLAKEGSKPMAARISVVLPQPDSPSTPTRSPASTVRSTPRTA